jgi:hypothetical protein
VFGAHAVPQPVTPRVAGNHESTADGFHDPGTNTVGRPDLAVASNDPFRDSRHDRLPEYPESSSQNFHSPDFQPTFRDDAAVVESNINNELGLHNSLWSAAGPANYVGGELDFDFQAIYGFHDDLFGPT